MRIGYADPPYPSCAHLYKDHPDYDGEVDHAELIDRLERDYDGWILHSSSTSIPLIVPMLPDGVRTMAWVKPFCAFKRNVSVAYAWEPVYVKACRKPRVTKRVVMRDFFSHGIMMKKGLTGAKPPKLVEWLIEVVGAELGDELHDMYPGTGIVEQTWLEWVAARESEDKP